jgi:hypothetical protein
MSNFWCVQPNWYGTGLSNQLFFVISAIIIANKKKISLVIFNEFRLHPCSDNTCPIKDIIDLNDLNRQIREYNVFVLDKFNTNLSILSVKYGNNTLKINITEDVKRKYMTSNNKLLIPNDVVLNDIKGDPIPGYEKKLFITYKINEFVFTEIFNEYRKTEICINLENFYCFPNWEDVNINTNNPVIFNKLLKNIKFTNIFNNISKNCILLNKNNEYEVNNFDETYKKLNVIHLRLENDMTYNMSLHNKIDEANYIKMLEDKYIEAINKYLSKEDKILVLSYDSNNRVFEYLKNNNYDYYITKKNIFGGREPHAIIDLLVGEKCNNIFIGNWNHEKNIGSTFSYVLDQRIAPSVKRIFIDIYNISDNIVIR